MAITYTWQITNLKKYDEFEDNIDVVVHARWKRVGTDEDGNTGEFNGATPLRLPDSGSANVSGSFTPFEQLTEETILGWIKNEIASLNGYEEHIVSAITKQIDAKKKPLKDVAMLPWGVQAVGVADAPAIEPNRVQERPRYVDADGQGV